MKVTPIKTRVFHENEDLHVFIEEFFNDLSENSVVVVSSKIVALSEGRVAEYVNEEKWERLIKDESEYAVPTSHVWLAVKNNIALPNAGIDVSNADGKLILLPSDSFAAAKNICDRLKDKFKLTNLGVIIADSTVVPLRAGTVAVALGYAGIKGLKDYRGQKDLFGRPFKFSTVNVADSLATAADVTMGEGAECQPLCLIEDSGVEFCNQVNKDELKINAEDDMFANLFK